MRIVMLFAHPVETSFDGDNFPCSTRPAGFLALDSAAMLRELGPGEIHEGAYASRSAKIGVGQHP